MTVYQQGTFKFPHEEVVLCDIQTPGTIVAHSLQLEGDHPSCAGGQGICEANHEIYRDGDKESVSGAGSFQKRRRRSPCGRALRVVPRSV